ncbi:MAG: flavodoxin domain-containing protein [Oscillospiraceae bacterium]|nr:flavodoxin domain-containing protein [Oscillospiraceae bacterium]
MKAIVYTSNTGYTKKYAEILSAKIGIPAYDSKVANQSIAKNDEVIYMGWLKASTVVGFEKAQKEYTVKAVCAVGMGNPNDKSESTITDRHHIKDVKVFYLQGGFDISKLHGFDKFLMKIFPKILKASAAKKDSKSDEYIEIMESIKSIKNGADFVSEANLVPVVSWLEK